MIKYQQIADKLTKRIASGQYRCGDRIPSEKEIADEFEVSVQTVNKAISSLVARGYVERHKGLGAFVSKTVNTEQLKEQNPFVIGIVIDSSVKNIGNANSVLGRITFNLQYILRQNNFSWVVISEIDGMSILDNLDEIDGLITIGDVERSFVELVSSRNIPCVTYNRDFSSEGLSSVMISNQGIIDLVKQMIEDGHENFIFVTDDAKKQVYEIRFEQFKGVLKEYGKKCNRLVISTENLSRMQLDNNNKELVASADFAFLPNDSLAIGFLNTLQANGFNVPEDISICGFDNSIAGRHCAVPLTTVTYDIFEACTVIEKVVERLLFSGEKLVKEAIDSWLILRDSTLKR